MRYPNRNRDSHPFVSMFDGTSVDAVYILSKEPGYSPPPWVREIATHVYPLRPFSRSSCDVNTSSASQHFLDWYHGLAHLNFVPRQYHPSSWQIGIKRSFAVWHAKATGHSSILLLDCDISIPTHNCALKPVCQIVDIASATAESFPDHSAVGHVARLLGAENPLNLSGQFCVVRLGENKQLPFFPSVYNEDWYFFRSAAASGSKLGRFEPVTQDVRDPFMVRRAQFEEFGDFWAETLARTTTEDMPLARTIGFWECARNRRMAWLSRLRKSAAHLTSLPVLPDVLDAAMLELAHIDVNILCSLECALAADTESWHDFAWR
jgi:hypothetical protein